MLFLLLIKKLVGFDVKAITFGGLGAAPPIPANPFSSHSPAFIDNCKLLPLVLAVYILLFFLRALA